MDNMISGLQSTTDVIFVSQSAIRTTESLAEIRCGKIVFIMMVKCVLSCEYYWALGGYTDRAINIFLFYDFNHKAACAPWVSLLKQKIYEFKSEYTREQ